MIILAFESSCDETSVSVIEDNKVLSNVIFSQIDIHKLYGGVVPEIASRSHQQVITRCLDEALTTASTKPEDIDLVCVTSGPGLIGSLIVGTVAAGSFALANKKPLLEVNHLDGHIYAAAIDNELKFPAIILLISGGHTELIFAENHYNFKIIGSTMDDAIGECYDKVARVLGLGYPGGPKIDKLACEGNPVKYHFPQPMIGTDDYNFSFSGLKSAVINKHHQLQQKNEAFLVEDFCSSFQKTVLDTILTKTQKALVYYRTNNLIIGGGVAANKGLRDRLSTQFKDYNVIIPKFEYCTDNAAMIAMAGKYKYDQLSDKDKQLLKNNYFIKPFSNKEE